jgi:tRNA nucleotidyltransferase/poly(A) polymerase
MSLLEHDGIEAELSRREFSFNAMAIRSDGVFVDPYRGRHDTRNRLLRLTGDNDQLLADSPLRVARVIRFSVNNEMRIYWKTDAQVRDFIRMHPEKILQSATQRLGREFFLGMTERPYDFIRLADHYNLLALVLPKLEPLKAIGIDSGETLFSHTLDTLSEIQDFMSTRKPRPHDLILSLVGLFHHAGAEKDKELDLKAGAEIAASYLSSWGASASIINRVIMVVQKFRMPYSETTEETICEFALRHGFDVVEAIMDFAYCNSLADKSKHLDIISANRVRFADVQRRFDEMHYRMDGPLSYLSEEDIGKKFPSANASTKEGILHALNMAVGTGQVGGRREALSWLSTVDPAKCSGKQGKTD